MIRRTNDYSGMSNTDFNKIAETIKKSENKKLYDSFVDKSEADVVCSELKIQGYKSSINIVGDKYNVYFEKPESVSFHDAEKSGQFKKLAWGRYSFQRESALGMFDYNFDDGSIWKLSNDENGNPVLVKQVEDEDEEVVVRAQNNNEENQQIPIQNTKVAANKRKRFDFVNANNLDAISKILYNHKINEELKKDIIISNSKNLLNNMNSKFNKIIDDKISELGIDERDIEEVKSLILTALNEEIQSKETLNTFLRTYKSDKINKVGKLKKHFD